MKNVAAKNEVDNQVDVKTGTDIQAKILAFLVGEFARTEARQCVSVDLIYSPGHGFRDEEIRTWHRVEEPKLFEDVTSIETLALTILEVAEGEADSKDPGRHRFIVRTRQYFGGRSSQSFTLHPTFTGRADREDIPDPDPDVDRVNDGQHDPRKRLLARVAGNVAAGIVMSPSPSATKASAIAEISVDIAEAILQKAGL